MGKAAHRARYAAEEKSRRRTFILTVVMGLALVAVAAGTGVVFARQKAPAPPAFAQPSTFAELAAIKPDELGKVDLARMNLLCASGLPGAEDLDLAGCLAALDRYATVVRDQTEKYLPMYSRAPEKFRNIEGFYRMQMMVTVLKQDLGIDYSADRSNDEPAEKFFANSKDVFVNGLLAPPHTGTCASLPVLVVAVGLRLGYPVHLVATRNHLFARWETTDGKERFNIECTNGGMTSHPDEYYTKGHFAWYDAAFSGEGFLQSMSPQKALADFLDLRGLCLRMNGRFSEAREAYQLASTLKPESKILAEKFRNVVREEQTGQLITKN
jgi:hypothetical protein